MLHKIPIILSSVSKFQYVGEHILPVLEKKTDQTRKYVLELLDIKYGQTRTENIEKIVEDWMRFGHDQFEDDRE